MGWWRREPPVAGEWSLGVRAVFLPRGTEIMAYATLPAEVRPVPVRILDMERFPFGPWRERTFELKADVVGQLHGMLARHYPELLPYESFQGLDGIDVRLAVTRVGVVPLDEAAFRFRMWTRECHSHTELAVHVAWDLLDPWRLEAIMSPDAELNGGA